MKHPAGNCDNCGHRLYARNGDGHFCPNCWHEPTATSASAPAAADD